MSAQTTQQLISSLNPNPIPTNEKTDDGQIKELGSKSEVPEWLRETENPPATSANEPIYSEPVESNPVLPQTVLFDNSKNEEKVPTRPTGELVGEQSLQNDPEATATTLYGDEEEALARRGFEDAHRVSSIV